MTAHEFSDLWMLGALFAAWIIAWGNGVIKEPKSRMPPLGIVFFSMVWPVFVCFSIVMVVNRWRSIRDAWRDRKRDDQ